MTAHLPLSVCLCTYNGAGRVGEVLAALGGQNAPGADWEVVVVDNASTDDTTRVVEEGLARHVPGRGRCVRELQPGLMQARRRATAEARGRVILFVDDDNIPAPDYVAQALAIMARHPEAGVVGGRVEADWLGEPTPLGRAVAGFALAVCDRGDQPFAFPDLTGGPAGAGMIVRREVMERVLADASLAERVAGRTGSSLLSGEDTVIVILAHQMGFTTRYEPALRMKHRIPASRTTPEYLGRLYEGIGRGQAAMRPLFDARARNPVLGTLIALKDGGRWLRGLCLGPSLDLRTQHGPLAADLHRLHLRQVYGRFRQGLREAVS